MIGYHPIVWYETMGGKRFVIRSNNAIFERMNEPAAVKDDDAKLRYDLIDPDAEAEIAAVLTYGAVKYGPENWRKLADLERRYYAAALRHIRAPRRRANPEVVDPESKLLHLAQAAVCIQFLLAVELEKGGLAPLEERLAEGLVNARRLKAAREAAKIPWKVSTKSGEVLAVGAAPTFPAASAAAARKIESFGVSRRTTHEVIVGEGAVGAVIDEGALEMHYAKNRVDRAKRRRR